MAQGNGKDPEGIPREPDTIGVTIPLPANSPLGGLVLHFPTAMFLPTGALEHRMHRSRFIRQVTSFDTAFWTEIYDTYAEHGRKRLNEQFPHTLRPPLEKLGVVTLDTSAITKAVKQEEEEEITPGAV